MLLHNQTSSPLSWEACGNTYKWDPYGACEVPDMFVKNLRNQGFPVDVAPVPPKVKATQAADAELAAHEAAEVTKLQKRIAEAEAKVAEAAKSVESADLRVERAEKRASDATSKLSTAEEQIKVLRSEIKELEKMYSDETVKVSDLQNELRQNKHEGAGAKKSGK